MNDIFTYDSVSTRPIDKDTLSFHRGYIPLLQVRRYTVMRRRVTV